MIPGLPTKIPSSDAKAAINWLDPEIAPVGTSTAVVL